MNRSVLARSAFSISFGALVSYCLLTERPDLLLPATIIGIMAAGLCWGMLEVLKITREP